MRLDLITYGCGDRFDIAKFKPIENAIAAKPWGGLWSSPVNSAFGWRDWCVREEFRLSSLGVSFEFVFDGDVFVIDGMDDLKKLPLIEYYPFIVYPDYEKVAQEYDAIFLTENGEHLTKYTFMYGWDCECVLVMNSKSIYPKGEVLQWQTTESISARK